jgi:phosphohistidine phosphatase SixA
MSVYSFVNNRTEGRLGRRIGTVLSAAFVTIAAVPTYAQENQQMEPAALVEALKGGGYVIFMRHGSTETDYADQIDAEMGNCASQRVLSEAGWTEVKAIGAAFERLAIPIGEVISSEYCRAWQSADLAFGSYAKNADLNFEPAKEYTEEQIATMRDRIMPHLSKAPQDGNTILVGHDDPFEAASGIYPEPMGVVFVLRPNGEDGFEVLGSITPDAWTSIP